MSCVSLNKQLLALLPVALRRPKEITVATHGRVLKVLKQVTLFVCSFTARILLRYHF